MLSAAEFQKIHADTYAGARQNFLNDRQLQGVLLLYNTEGTQAFALLSSVNTSRAEMKRVFLEQGVMLIPGSWQDHLPQLQALVDTMGAVAGTLVSEIWVAHNEAARDVVEMGIGVSEHPLRDEAIVVVSVYPSQQFSATSMARIVRERNGPGLSLEPFAEDVCEVSLAEWLINLLPQS